MRSGAQGLFCSEERENNKFAWFAVKKSCFLSKAKKLTVQTENYCFCIIFLAFGKYFVYFKIKRVVRPSRKKRSLCAQAVSEQNL